MRAIEMTDPELLSHLAEVYTELRARGIVLEAVCSKCGSEEEI